MQDVEPFGIGLHQPVFDTVMHHLDEMAGAVRAAMNIAALRRAAFPGAARRSLDRADAGRERGEDRVEPPDRLGLAADHHAIAALQPPDAAPRPDIDVVDALRL